jgi:hypothetical protein
MVAQGNDQGKYQYWQSIHGHRQVKGFLKRPSAQRAEELLNLSGNQLSVMPGLLTAHCHFKKHLNYSW